MDKVFAFKVYPVTLPANGAFRLPAAGAYFRVMSATGAVDVTVEGVGTLPALQAGQAFKGINFNGLVLQDASGAPNTVQLLVASAEFQDNRLNGTVDLSASSLTALESVDLNAATLATMRQPLQSTRNWNSTAAMVANTPLTVFSSASNVNGAVLLSAGYQQAGSPTLPGPVFIMKSGAAPTSVTDGEIVCCASQFNEGTTTLCATAFLPAPVFVPSGFGLYLISADALTALAANRPNLRHASWRDL